MIKRQLFFTIFVLFLSNSIFADEIFLDSEGIQKLSVELELCIDSHVDNDVCIGTFSSPCLETSEGLSTAGMRLCQSQESESWDILLNHYYQTTIAVLNGYEIQEATFAPEGKPSEIYRDAQRAWLSFRDAEVEKERLIWYGGSGSTVFAAGRHLNLTAERTIALFSFCNSLTYDTQGSTSTCLLYPE